MNTEIYEKVKKILIESLKIEESKISPEADFKDALGMDSLEQAELIMDLEKVFDCSIDEQQAEKIKTVEDAVNYLDKI